VQEKLIYTAKDVAEMAGLTERTIQEMFSKGKIPGAFPMGSRKRWVIAKEDFNNWLQVKRKEALQDKMQASV